MEKRIGFIGLGVMGSPMCRHLMKAAESVFVYNRTKSKADDLVADGAVWCDTAGKVAENSDIVFTIVGYPSDVEEIYLGKNGLVDAARQGQLFIDMTTTKPSLDEKIAAYLAEKGAGFVDAPVSGGDVGARNATLSIMAGGSDKDFAEALPYLKLLGSNIAHLGRPGAGQHTKMANQIVIAGTMIGVSEALVYASKAGLDLKQTVSTISKGAAGCWTLDNLAPRVIGDDFAPGFMIDHFVKDMSIALEESERFGLELKGLALVRKLYCHLQEEGMGRYGTQALVKAIEKTAKED